MIGSGDDLDTYEEVAEDKGISVEKDFEEVVVSLDKFAGKTIRICFANYTKKENKNLLKIDDLAVIAYGMDAVESISGEGSIIQRRYFTVEGIEVSYPVSGLYIIMDTMSDGRQRCYKKKF